MQDRVIKWAPFNSVINGDKVLMSESSKKDIIMKPTLSEDQIEYFLDKLGLKEYSDIFKELEDSFIESTQNSWYKYYLNYQRPCSIESLINQLEYKEHQINDLTKSIVKLENDVNNLNAELRNIVNSKSWKITKPLRNFRKRKNR